MDTEWMSKFPCGGSWWKVQHPAASEWQQAFYEGTVVERVPPPSSAAPVQPSHPTREARKHEHMQDRTRGMVPVCEYIMDAIDPCASLYTVTQKLDAVQWLKQRLFNFVSSDAHMYLGPKKSRVLSTCLSGNPSKVDYEPIVREFITLLLGEAVQATALHLDRRGQWFVKSKEE
jgi:hypothetical protein